MEIVISMKSNQTIIGVDPGKQGYITVMRKSGIVHYPMPKVGKELDPHELSELIVRISEECDAENTMVVIEDVHALHNSAASATWNFGFVCGMLRMAFIMCGLPIVLVPPKKWQKEMYEGIKVSPDKKVMSVLAAKRLFPQQDLRRTRACKKPDDNLTDSLLIAEYGRRHYL